MYSLSKSILQSNILKGFFKNLSELSSDSKMVMSSLFSILTELELAGLVSSQDGYRYFFEKECSCKN